MVSVMENENNFHLIWRIGLLISIATLTSEMFSMIGYAYFGSLSLKLSGMAHTEYSLYLRQMHWHANRFCNLTVSNISLKGNSTSRDVVIACGFNTLAGSLPFIISLRSTGSKASCVIFTNKKARNFPVYLELFEKYGVQLIYVDLHGLPKKDIYYVRHIIYYHFYRKNRDKIDSVVETDLFDTVFQADPFHHSGNPIIFSAESQIIQRSPFTNNLLQKCIKHVEKIVPWFKGTKEELYNRIKVNTVINGGTVYGSIENMIEYKKGMIRTGENHTAYTIDQGCANMLIYMGFFNFSYKLDGGNLGTLSSIAILPRNETYGVLGSIYVNHNVPAIIHQYDRHGKLKKEIIAKCPNDRNVPDFMR